MPYEIIRSDEEIDDILNSCVEADDSGVSQFPGTTYEQGVMYAIEWLTSRAMGHPLEE